MTLGPGNGLYVKAVVEGAAVLVRVDSDARSERLPMSGYRGLRKPAADADHLVGIMEGAWCAPRVGSWQGEKWVALRQATAERYREALSDPIHVTIPANDEHAVDGVLYPAVGGEPSQPNAVISVYGGPTSTRGFAYDAEAQFLATRGYSVLLLNHRGPTSYG